MNILFLLVLSFVCLIELVNADYANSYCDWIPCTCAKPSTFAAHWNMDGPGMLKCADYLGNDWMSVPRFITTSPQYVWTCKLNPATQLWENCADTQIPYDNYSKWNATNPFATTACQEYTAKMSCLFEYFPCNAATNDYAPYPCRDTYLDHVRVCGQQLVDSFYTIITAGFTTDSYSFLNGAWGNYNGGMCYHKDFTMGFDEDKVCLRTEFRCQNNGTFSAECAYCECPPGWSGMDCSICTSNQACISATGDSSQICLTDTGPQDKYVQDMTCTVGPGSYFTPFVGGSVPQTISWNLQNSTGFLEIRGVSRAYDPDWLHCDFFGCSIYYDGTASGTVCKDSKQSSPCILCNNTLCACNPIGGHFNNPTILNVAAGLSHKPTSFSCSGGSSSCNLLLGLKFPIGATCNTGYCYSTYVPTIAPTVPPLTPAPPPIAFFDHSVGFYFRYSLAVAACIIPLMISLAYLTCVCRRKSALKDPEIRKGSQTPFQHLLPVTDPKDSFDYFVGKFEFSNISCKIKNNFILRNVSCVCNSGAVVAVMGPSGAGKTSLVDILSGRKVIGNSTGSVMLKGEELTERERRTLIGYVYQDEKSLMSTLTVREAIAFSGKLRLGSLSAKDLNFKVNKVLQDLGILHIGDSIIGGGINLIRGISGGEKKRVAIGLELIANPRVLIIDEPTSGLDAASATVVMETIHNIAINTGCIVIVTIHQPRFDIYNKFDKILLLSKGGIQVMQDSPEKCISFCEQYFHKTVPQGANAADFLLDCLSTLNDAFEIEKLRDHVKGLSNGIAIRSENLAELDTSDRLESGVLSSTSNPLHKNDANYVVKSTPSFFTRTMICIKEQLCGIYVTRASVCTQLSCLTSRELKNTFRNPLLLLLHIIAATSVGLLVGFMFRNVTLDNAGVQNRAGMLFFTEAFLGFMSMSSLGIWREERLIVIRESIGGYYSRLNYTFVKCILDAILLRFIPTLVYCCCCYWFTGLQDTPLLGSETFPFHFLWFTMTCIGISLGTTSLCVFISTVLPTESTSNLVAILLILIQLVFGGFLISKNNFPEYFVFIQKSSVFNYANEALMVNEFMGLEFKFDPQGFDGVVPENFKISGEDWLKQFFFYSENMKSDIVLLFIISLVLYLLSSFAINLIINEKR